MIVFELECRAGGHRFEGWFGSSDDFASQQERGLVTCPHCESRDIVKAPMAPMLARKGNQRTSAPQQGVPTAATAPSAPTVPSAPTAPSAPTPVQNAPIPPEAAAKMLALARMQAEALKSSRWVGDKFADSARAMHYGEREHEVIHGQSTIEEAEELLQEGIAVAPLPFPVVPPGEAN
jgi:hypothetical protein